MKTRIESLLGWTGLVTILAVPLVVLLVLAIHNSIVSGKQVEFDRSKARLLAALSVVPEDKTPAECGVPLVYRAATNPLVINNKKYFVKFYADGLWSDRNKGYLAITTNRDFIWIDYKRGPKIIAGEYKVPRWRSGY